MGASPPSLLLSDRRAELVTSLRWLSPEGDPVADPPRGLSRQGYGLGPKYDGNRAGPGYRRNAASVLRRRSLPAGRAAAA